MIRKNKSNHYDIIIIGAGPAGIFAALELSKNESLNILILEKGPPLNKRNCPRVNGSVCKPCKSCSITSGWGGAGAFSDGKLTLTTDVGGWLDEFRNKQELNFLVEEVKRIFLEYGAPLRIFTPDEENASRLKRKARLAELELITFPILHLGTENAYLVLENFYEHLKNKFEIHFNEKAESISKSNNLFVVESSKDTYTSDFVIACPGREGADWLISICRELGIPVQNNAVDIGVRVEVPAEIMDPVTDVLYEAKLHYTTKTFEDKVRTFCMNPHGFVTTEVYEDVITVNGHAYAERKTENTNFAILVSKNFTEPFKEPIAYGKYIARLANILSGGIIVQRLYDIELGRRSTPERLARSVVKPTLEEAVPGDLSLVFPYRHFSSILEMLRALDNMIPGVASRHTLLYGVEVKFYSARVQLNDNLETPVSNFYAVGDGAGITRGLVQSSISGIIAGRSIRQKLSGGKA
ncbi:MAG: NAD(P)/FAD-dependent oxidoreductase [Actinobacteria bacterium]|nr:NAD(P)/FAD-dependent oxidoreductase [Actinomycetota bacterium]